MSGTPVVARVRNVNGKGRGLFAEQRIGPGDQIIADPLLFERLQGEELFARPMKARFRRLRVLRRNEYDGLFGHRHFANDFANQAGGNTAPIWADRAAIFKSNSFSAVQGWRMNGKQMDSVVFAKISRANHSCTPNAAIAAEEGEDGTKYQLLLALVAIEQGEEIVIQYTQTTDMAHKHRVSEFYDSWRFQCDCPICAIETILIEGPNVCDFSKRMPKLVNAKVVREFNQRGCHGSKAKILRCCKVLRTWFDHVLTGYDNSRTNTGWNNDMEEMQARTLRKQMRKQPSKFEHIVHSFQVAVAFYEARIEFLKQERGTGRILWNQEVVNTFQHYAELLRRGLQLVGRLTQKVTDLSARDFSSSSYSSSSSDSGDDSSDNDLSSDSSYTPTKKARTTPGRTPIRAPTLIKPPNSRPAATKTQPRPAATSKTATKTVRMGRIAGRRQSAAKTAGRPASRAPNARPHANDDSDSDDELAPPPPSVILPSSGVKRKTPPTPVTPTPAAKKRARRA